MRVSFNSFIPRDVSDDLANRLVNYYIDRLLSEPHLHDKVEFRDCLLLLHPGFAGAAGLCSRSTDSQKKMLLN